MLRHTKSYFLRSMLFLQDHHWCKDCRYFCWNNLRQTNAFIPFQIQLAQFQDKFKKMFWVSNSHFAPPANCGKKLGHNPSLWQEILQILPPPLSCAKLGFSLQLPIALSSLRSWERCSWDLGLPLRKLRPGFAPTKAETWVCPTTKTGWGVSVSRAQSPQAKKGFDKEPLLLQQRAQIPVSPGHFSGRVQVQESKETKICIINSCLGTWSWC